MMVNRCCMLNYSQVMISYANLFNFYSLAVNWFSRRVGGNTKRTYLGILVTGGN